VDPLTAAHEARRLFADAADALHTKWLDLEIAGYGEVVDVVPVHALLGVTENDRLAIHVIAYRTQRGKAIGPAGTAVEFRHFFVESLAEIVRARGDVAGSSGSGSIELGFSVDAVASTHPTSGLFGRDVFDRIVGGFVAALYLQLDVLAR
jgi:hypothetical protein